MVCVVMFFQFSKVGRTANRTADAVYLQGQFFKSELLEEAPGHIDEFGVKEPEITTQGRNQVVVKLPGVTDRERAKDIAGKAAGLPVHRLLGNYGLRPPRRTREGLVVTIVMPASGLA